MGASPSSNHLTRLLILEPSNSLSKIDFKEASNSKISDETAEIPEAKRRFSTISRLVRRTLSLESSLRLSRAKKIEVDLKSFFNNSHISLVEEKTWRKDRYASIKSEISEQKASSWRRELLNFQTPGPDLAGSVRSSSRTTKSWSE